MLLHVRAKKRFKFIIVLVKPNQNDIHLQNFHCLRQRKTQAERALFPRQMYLLFDQSHIHLYFFNCFFI